MAKHLTGLVALAATGTLLLAGCAGTPIASGPAATTGGEIAAAPGFDPATKTIRVGSLVPVSGVFAGAVTNLQGMQAYFDTATAAGGDLEGYTIELDNQDTKYDPATAIPLYNGMKDNVSMFSMMLGAPIIDALLPSMEDEDILGVPAGIIPKFLREPNLLPTFPNLNAYHAAAVEYAAEEKGMADSVFCATTTEDVFGDSILDAFNFSAEELNLTVGTTVKFAGNTDFTAQIIELKEKGCEVVLMGGVGPVMQNFAVKAVQLDFNPLLLASNTSYTVTIATGPGADWLKEHALFAVTGTEWGAGDADGQPALEASLATQGTEIVPTANAYQTGYVNAKVTVDVLAKAIANGDMSRAGILKVAHEELGDVDDLGMAGGTYSYGASVEDRVPPHLMSLFTVSADVPAGLALETYNYDSQVAAKLQLQ
jgi:ABC-type branched-subunit amino acid transport system substrate-binding protein